MSRPALGFIQILIIIIATSSAKSQLLCPPKEEIAPCDCNTIQERAYCFGEEFVQADIDRLVSSVRAANNILPDEWLYVRAFEIMYSSLTTLNVTSLNLLQVTDLTIINNPQLKTIIGPWSDDSNSQLQLRAQMLDMTSNSLDDDGLGQFLTHFEPELLWSIILSGNNFHGGQYVSDEGYVEFLPGFSKLRRLQSISLGHNNISSLAGGQFRRQRRIYIISLSSNPLIELGQDAFAFDEQDAHLFNHSLQIGMTLVQLPGLNISPQNGLDSNSRPIRFMLVQDYALETLTEDAWAGIVFKNPFTRLILHYSTIVCDSRVKWMKDARAELEHRVESAYCSNDPDPYQTVFTSDLVQ